MFFIDKLLITHPIFEPPTQKLQSISWGYWNGVHVRAELKGTLAHAWGVSKYTTLWYLHVPLGRYVLGQNCKIYRQSLVKIPLKRHFTSVNLFGDNYDTTVDTWMDWEPSIYVYEGSTCMYVRLNALNILHMPRPRFIAPYILVY